MNPGVSEHKAYILSTFVLGQKKNKKTWRGGGGALPFLALILASQSLLVLAPLACNNTENVRKFLLLFNSFYLSLHLPLRVYYQDK